MTAYLTRFKGSSREHTESDLRCYLTWCADHGLDPLAVQRFHLELYVRCSYRQAPCTYRRDRDLAGYQP